MRHGVFGTVSLWREMVGDRLMPGIAMSDNANPAVAVTKAFKSLPGRCAPHCLQVTIKRRMFNDCTDADEVVGGPPEDPGMFQAMEVLREWARALVGPTLRQWITGKYGGAHGRSLHVDSGADWFTSEELVRSAIAMRSRMAAFTASHEDMPPLPTPHQWQLLESLLEPLENIGAAMRILQTTDALACVVLPVFQDLLAQFLDGATMDGVVGQINSCFAWELERIFRVHLQKAFEYPVAGSNVNPLVRIMQEVGVKSYEDVLSMSAILSVGADDLADWLDLADALVPDAEEDHCMKAKKRSIDLFLKLCCALNNAGNYHPPTS